MASVSGGVTAGHCPKIPCGCVCNIHILYISHLLCVCFELFEVLLMIYGQFVFFVAVVVD